MRGVLLALVAGGLLSSIVVDAEAAPKQPTTRKPRKPKPKPVEPPPEEEPATPAEPEATQTAAEPPLEPDVDKPADPPPPAIDQKPEPAKLATKVEEDPVDKAFNLAGYIQPGFSVLHRGDAVPRDRWRYGAESTRAGLIMTGQPVSRWSYTLELVVAGESNDLVSSVDIVDENGDGVPDEVASSSEPIAGLFVERALVEVELTKRISLVAGRKRVPFTVQEQSPSTALMFPTRSGPNEAFIQGPDFGAGVSFRLPDDLFVAQLGVYNGTGEPLGATDDQGLVYSGRLDFNPLGELPLGEQATGRGPLRVGVGAGVLFYASRHFDEAGFAGARQRDLRASASLRVAVSGFYLQSEILRRQRTDSLSDRPEITTGAYAQFSWLFSQLVAPLGRFGWAAEDQGFATRSTVWVEGGLAVYPSRSDPDSIRVTALYIEEHRLTESERANGAAVQLQLTW